MIVKTLRDAELALNALERQMNTLLLQATNSTGVSIADVKRIVSQTQRNQIVTNQTFTNASQFDLTDIDATPSEGQILHRLIHLFYGDVRFAKSIRLADGWFSTLDGLRQWKTNIGFDNPIGGADPNYQIRWLDSVTPALNYSFFLDPTLGLMLGGSVIPLVTRGGDLGNSSLLWDKLWFGDNLNQIAESAVAYLFSTYYGNTATSANAQWFRRARGTEAAPTDVLVNSKLGSVGFQAWRNSAWRETSSFEAQVDALPGASDVAALMHWRTTNSAGVNDRRWDFRADGDIAPHISNAYDLGASGKRIRKVWAVDIDFSGTITGTLPATDANTQLNANASASPTVTTTFADLSGATVSLDKDGTWLVICTVVGSKEINDDEIQGQLVYDGTAQSGIIRMAASTANFIRTTGTRSWPIVVTGQPKTAKIQVKKNAGTGTSSVDATNSNIVAVYLTA
jgi:hypothetical protein